jgi:hypothetical protein
MSARSYNSKVIACGDVIEIYEYRDSILEGFDNSKSKGKGRRCVADEVEQANNRELVLHRARRDLRRLINSNINMYSVKSKFVTLTFREHITTLEQANYEWKKFRQRLEDYLEKCIRYVVVPEFTKIGRVHYHVVFFDIPYIQNKKLQEIWGQGFVKINAIDDVDNVGAYVCKYMTKCEESEENSNKIDKLKGKKCYFSSRKLYKPIEIKQKDRVESLATALPASALTYENTFENEYNSVSYKQYNMKRVKIEDGI